MQPLAGTQQVEISKFEKQVLQSFKKPFLKPFEHYRTTQCNVNDLSAQQQPNEETQENTIELVLYVMYVKDSAAYVGDEAARQVQQRIDMDISKFTEALQFNMEACIEDFQRE